MISLLSPANRPRDEVKVPLVASPQEIQPGQVTSVDLYGTRVAIANVGGSFYAIADACPDLDGSLSAGKLEDGVISCPSCGSKFDVITGHVVSGPAQRRVRTYHLQIDGDELRL